MLSKYSSLYRVRPVSPLQLAESGERRPSVVGTGHLAQAQPIESVTAVACLDLTLEIFEFRYYSINKGLTFRLFCDHPFYNHINHIVGQTQIAASKQGRLGTPPELGPLFPPAQCALLLEFHEENLFTHTLVPGPLCKPDEIKGN